MTRRLTPTPIRTSIRTPILATAALLLSACAAPTAPDGPAPRADRTSRVPDVAPVTTRPATPLEERRAPDPANVMHDPSLFQDLDWDWVGPARGGRVTAVAGVRGQPGTYYAGSTGGGLWKTTNYGDSWRNVSDGFFETGSIGAVRVAPSNPNVVWVATGSDGYRSNIITGKGVYRSTDAGASWRFLGLRDIGNTGAIEVHPRDPDVAYVAAIGHPFGPNPERGLYRTTDGGETWENVLFISDSTGVVDVEIDPRDPDVLYASTWRAERRPWTIISGAREGGIYKSTDGGDSWTELTDGLPTGDGELFGKTDLALSPSSPRTLYALIEAPEPEDGLYRSDDAGATWRQVSSHDGLTARAFYYTNVDVDPTDPDIVWVNAHGPLFRSRDGGARWHTVSTPHGDNHDMWIDPANTQLMVQGNDGGANVSRDGGATWSSQLNQPTAEMYQVATDDRFPYWVWGGQQDREIVAVPSRPAAVGDEVSFGGGTCETGPAVPRPGDPDVVYAACKGRFMVWDWRTGQTRHNYVGGVYMYGHAPRDLPFRFQRVSPVEVSPHDADVVYHGSQYVHRTTDAGRTWTRISPDLTATPPGTQGVPGEPITRDVTGEEVYSTLYAIEESPLEPGVIWTGSYDGPFHVTRDGGATWTDVTPPALPAGGRVQSIEPSPHDAGTAYYALFRFMLDDWAPYVWKTEDYGATWSRLTTGTNGIPADYPVRVVREDPVRPGLLYAGTEFGFYVSFNDGRTWQPLQLDLPVTPVTDIELKDDDLVIATMGRGFWILRDLTPLRGLSDGILAADAHLFPPGTATLVDWRTWGRQSPVTPEYGDPGAVIDWLLTEDPEGPVTVELLTADGTVVNGWSSEGAGFAIASPDASVPPAERGMREPETLRVEGPTVAAQAGHTRFVAPLSHPGAWEPGDEDEAPSLEARGPRLAPGSYQVRVSTAEWSETRPLTVVMDPRVAEIGVTADELRAQEALALRVRDLLSRANRLLASVESALEAAETAETAEGAETAEAARPVERLRELHALLTEDETVAYPQPMLVEQIEYLYSMVAAAPQAPPADAFERARQLEAELEEMERRVQAVL